MSKHPLRLQALHFSCLVVLALGAGTAAAFAEGEASGGLPVGPDVTVYNLTGFGNSYAPSGGFHAYSIGTTSCNIGDEPLNWCDNGGGCGPLTSAQHPVIAQNLFRLKDGRFEQIGASWLKHGFLSTNSFASDCQGPGGQTCTSPPLGSDQLGVGCTDTYGSSLNGSRPLGMRAEVNATTGVFPFPETIVATSTDLDQRMKVADVDLDPALNVGALYWGEGHYVGDNDAQADNAFNNASYRLATVTAGSLNLNFSGSTVREKWAIDAWPLQDLAVELIQVAFASAGAPREGFNVGRRVTEVTPGNWHYEYAVHNMNSDRGAQRLEIDFVDGTTVTNIGFHDVDHHSGEYVAENGLPISTTDWIPAFDSGSGVVSWETDLYSIAPEANAIRWSTMYNFWFDADAGPTDIDIHTIDLFRPGIPSSVTFWESPTNPNIFSDGFESGDTSAWSSTVP